MPSFDGVGEEGGGVGVRWGGGEEEGGGGRERQRKKERKEN